MVPGPPQGKARARTVHHAGSGRTMSYTPANTVLYENLIKTMYCQETGHIWDQKEPLNVEILAVYGVPKSVSKKERQRMLCGDIFPTKKPDADNISKVVLDALNGIAYKDDSQVVYLNIFKMYGNVPYVKVLISDMQRK